MTRQPSARSTRSAVTDELLEVNRGAGDGRDDTLRAVTVSVVEQGLADSVSVMEIDDDGALRARLSTHPDAAAAAQLQCDSGEGPSVDAATSGGPAIASSDVATDARWPRWGPAAATAGVRASLSVTLSTSSGPIGVLNLFHRQVQAFTTDDLDMAVLIGGHLSIELAHTRHTEQLWRAIDARNLIGQAQGIIMHAYHVDAITAFSVLRRLSQQSNTKLSALATEISRARALPPHLDPTRTTDSRPEPCKDPAVPVARHQE